MGRASRAVRDGRTRAPGSLHGDHGTGDDRMTPPVIDSGQVMLVERIRLACLPSSPFWARRHAQDVLGKWCIPDDVLETAELLVSELVTNAAKFSTPGPAGQPPASGMGIVDVALRYFPGRVVIEVWDADVNPPIPGEPDQDAESGRGLILVQALSKEWSFFFPRSGGKVVYCVLEVTADHIAGPGGKGISSHG
jgi:anti-sigma regulatory factor (Ser/Thr protein kinase)